jgi:hypothetical protein
MPEFIFSGIFLLHCAVYCVLIMLAIAPIGFVNPRIMLQDYPPEIQKAVPPKTDREKKLMIPFAILIFLVMFGYPSIIGWTYRPVDPSFQYFFFVVWSMMLIFNLFDLIVLDWIVFCSITPRFIVIEGTEGNTGYKNYKFHFPGFLKGIAITLLIAVSVAGFLTLLTYI